MTCRRYMTVREVAALFGRKERWLLRGGGRAYLASVKFPAPAVEFVRGRGHKRRIPEWDPADVEAWQNDRRTYVAQSDAVEVDYSAGLAEASARMAAE